MTIRELMKNEVMEASKDICSTENFEDFREQVVWNLEANNIYIADVEEKMIKVSDYTIIDMYNEIMDEFDVRLNGICQVFITYVDLFGGEFIEEAYEAQL